MSHRIVALQGGYIVEEPCDADIYVNGKKEGEDHCYVPTFFKKGTHNPYIFKTFKEACYKLGQYICSDDKNEGFEL